MSSAAFLLAPEQMPSAQDKLAYNRWQIKADRLIEYRGAYRKIKPMRGGSIPAPC